MKHDLWTSPFSEPKMQEVWPPPSRIENVFIILACIVSGAMNLAIVIWYLR